MQSTQLGPRGEQHLGCICPTGYVSWSSGEATWHFVSALYNHLWEPKGDLGALCGVYLNPRQGRLEQISLARGRGEGRGNELRKSSLGNKGGLEQLNIFLLVQTLERSVLPWLGPSPGCTWAGFNPRIGLYKRKGWARRAPGFVGEQSPPYFALAQDGARVQIKWLPF